MQACRLFHPPGEIISLVLVPEFDEQFEARLVRAMAEVFDDLSQVMQPIAADLTLACRERDTPFFDRSVNPALNAWYIREADPPAHVSLWVKSGTDLQVTQAPSLDAETVSRWVVHALAQNSPSPEHVVTVSALECFSTRARLYDRRHLDGAGEFRLQDADTTLKIPVERREEQWWVSGPALGLDMYPAIAFEIANYDGMLNTKLWVSWSCWAERGTPEQEALERALQSVVARGWKPEVVPAAFKLGTAP